MSKIFVWSGGFDSTLLIYNEVLNIKDSKSISTLSISYDSISDIKMKSEQLSRQSFTEFIKSKYDVTIENKTISIPNYIGPVSGNTDPNKCGGHKQALLFFTICAMYAGDGDEIVFGFHRRDDFFASRDNLDTIKNVICLELNKKVEFKYPLEFVYKYEVLKDIYKAGIERFCWTCENPVDIMK
jgi:7-cyano-7-deazaguanine synthase in queuosine biosynthesis